MRKYIYHDSDFDDQWEKQEHLPIGLAQGKPIKIYKDGSIEATAFRDGTDDNMEYIETVNKNVYFQKNLNNKVKLVYLPKHWDIFYKVFHTGVFYLKKAFANFIGKVKRFHLFKSGRYKHAPRVLRREIKKLLKEGKRFVFTDNRPFGVTTKPYIESTTLGPYVTSVEIKTNSDINLINDLIVIKTGQHLSSGPDEKIVYIYLKIVKVLLYINCR